jgi:hypothetical protein
MKNLRNDPALAELPPPITLTLDELAPVAAGCVVIIIGTSPLPVAPVHVAGGIPVERFQ